MNEKELNEKEITKLEDFDTTTTNKRAKTIITIGTSLILVGAMILGGSRIAKISNRNKDVSEPEPTSNSQEYNENQNDGMFLELCEDFDINDKNAVADRAKAIYELSEKKLDVAEIRNIIYLINEKFSEIDYNGKTTDEDKFRYVQKLVTEYSYQLLNDNISDEAERASNLMNEEKNLKSINEGQHDIYAYMFQATSEGKNSAFEIAQIVEAQNDNIKNSNVKGFDETGEQIIDATEGLKNVNLSDGYGTLDYLDCMSKEPLWPVIKMDTNYVDSYSNALFSSWAKTMGIDYSKLLESNSSISKTKEGNKYNAKDSADANSKENTTQKANDEQKGGKHVGTQTSVKDSNVTTKKHSESSTVPVTEGKNDEGVEITTAKNGDGHGEVTEKGGEVVEEETKVSGGDLITKKEEPTTKKEEPTKETTTNKTESTTFVEEDVEDLPIYTDDEFDNENKKAAGIGSGMMGAGFLTLLSGKKRRRR